MLPVRCFGSILHKVDKIQGFIHDIWVYIFIKKCKLCIPSCTKFYGNSHTSLTLTLVL